MPYDKLSDIPDALQGIDPSITLAQANSIARCADELEKKGEVKSPWGVCVASFKKAHVAKDGAWAERKEGKTASFEEMTRRVREAWYATFQRDTLPKPVEGSAWVKEVYEDRIIIEAESGLLSYSYTVTDEGIEFGEPVKVEVEYRAASSLPVKMLSETKDAWVIGGYGLVWGSEHARDLSPWPNQDGTQGEFFTPETQGLDDIPVKAMTFEHDKETDEDGKPIKEAVGHTILERDDTRGRWIEAQLAKGRQYARLVVDLMSEGNLYLSSETADHWREVAGNGEVKRWRTAGYTFTTHPMEPRIGSVSQVKAAYKAAGLDLPQLDEGGESAGADCQKAEAERMKAKIEILLAETKLLEV